MYLIMGGSGGGEGGRGERQYLNGGLLRWGGERGEEGGEEGGKGPGMVGGIRTYRNWHKVQESGPNERSA